MRVLLLSTTTGYQIRSFGDSAERLGIELMFGSDRCRNLDDPWRDGAVPVRFHEPDASVAAIVRAAEQRPIDGVLAVGDRPVVLAARVAQALGLRGNTPDAAAASANKTLARERFAAAGLLVPWFVEVPVSAESEATGDSRPSSSDCRLSSSDRRLSTGDPLTTDDRRLSTVVKYPCVIKPIGLSGSRGVIRADTLEELDAAVARVRRLLARKDVKAIRSGLEERLLVEGYIDGPEFAIEGVLTNGRLHAFAIFDKPDPLRGPFFEETIYVTPSALPPETQARVIESVQRAASALGLTHGPVHAECRIASDGVFVLEVAARPIGGLCSKVLRFGRGHHARAELSLEDLLLRHATGDDVSEFSREPRAAGVMMIPIPKRGILKKVEGRPAAGAVPLVEDVRITAKKDQLLEPLPEAGSYLGFIFARGATSVDVVGALRAAHGELRFVIDTPIAVTVTIGTSD